VGEGPYRLTTAINTSLGHHRHHLLTYPRLLLLLQSLVSVDELDLSQPDVPQIIAAAALKTPTINCYNAQGVNLTF